MGLASGQRVGIKIMPRDVILDVQGRAVESSMKSNGYSVHSCRVGKYIEMNLSGLNREQARLEVEKMLKQGGLYNALIEKYEIEFLSNATDFSAVTQ